MPNCDLSPRVDPRKAQACWLLSLASPRECQAEPARSVTLPRTHAPNSLLPYVPAKTHSPCHAQAPFSFPMQRPALALPYTAPQRPVMSSVAAIPKRLHLLFVRPCCTNLHTSLFLLQQLLQRNLATVQSPPRLQSAAPCLVWTSNLLQLFP